MAEMDLRKESILRAIVIEYVNQAEPVGSEALLRKYDLGVRSATIRNEMAELSDIGLLEQPHTSSGRIPSDGGYRYFVDRLILTSMPAEKQKKSVEGAVEEADALYNLLRETAKTLSRITHLLTVAATLQEQSTTAKTAVVSALGQSRALFVLALSNGHIENKMIELPSGVNLEDIGAINEALTQTVVGQSLKSLKKIKSSLLGGTHASEKLWTSLAGTIRAFAKEFTRGKLITEGEEFILAQPEFARDTQAVSELLDSLESPNVLYEAITGEPSQQVTIGAENKAQAFRRLSIIRQNFSVGNHEAGIIALVGPTRLNYEAGIPLVNYTARALSESLTKYFA